MVWEGKRAGVALPSSLVLSSGVDRLVARFLVGFLTVFGSEEPDKLKIAGTIILCAC